MPRRTKPSTADTRASIAASLREWGVQSSKGGIHSAFSNKITSLAIKCIESARYDSDDIDLEDMIKIPKDRDEAIVMVFVTDLLEYRDDEMCELRADEINDALEEILTKRDDTSRIVGRAPYYLLQEKPYIQTRKRPSFLPFRDSDLDPFKRFSLSNEGLSNAQVAYDDCSDEGWLNGYAFEAIVSSHAVHNEACYRCRRRNSLVWCGGADYSWKDLFCRSCKSCFEIKSKADKETIDRIFRFDKLQGGSFKRWCAESHEDRVEGSDFIVLVSRKPSYIKRNEWAWSVEIAEVGSVRPTVTAFSIATRCKDNQGFIRTVLTLKHRRQWFKIPVGDTKPHLENLFRESFEKVFPGEWERVAPNCDLPAEASVKVEAEPRVTKSTTTTNVPPVTVDQIKSELEDLAVDDWEDYNSD